MNKPWKMVRLMTGEVVDKNEFVDVQPPIDEVNPHTSSTLVSTLLRLTGQQVRITVEVPYRDEDYLRDIDKLHRERDEIDRRIKVLRDSIS